MKRTMCWLGTALVSAVLACGGSENDPAVPPPPTPATPPGIVLSTNTAAFSAVAFGDMPGSMTIDVTNSGKDSLPVTLGEIQYDSISGNWVSVKLDGSVTPTVLRIQPFLTVPVGLKRQPIPVYPGTYTAKVQVLSPTAANSPQTISMTMTVAAPPLGAGETLEMSTTDLTVTTSDLYFSPSVVVKNTGSHTVWSLRTDSVTYSPPQTGGWLFLLACAFPDLLAGATQGKNIVAVPGERPIGKYKATIWVSGLNTNGSTPGTLTMDVQWEPPPVASVSLQLGANSIRVGDQTSVTVIVKGFDGSALQRIVTLNSSNTDVVSVLDLINHPLLGMSPGTATITATSGGVSASAAITVTELGPPLIASSVAASEGSSCALDGVGAAFCWGHNTDGQLGDGTNVNRAAPVRVSGGLRLQNIVLGANHACGRISGDVTYCWGFGGTLGDGKETSARSPVAVAGGLAFKSIASGGNQTCGLTAGGSAYCWGGNIFGQVGDGTTTARFAPVAVAGGLAFQNISTNFSHTCAVTIAGAAYCWGMSIDGTLGDGAIVSAPAAVPGGLTFRSIAVGGFHACGLTTAGAAYCWGYNLSGAIGDGTTVNRSSPVAVAGGLTFQSIAAGAHHTCALTVSGAAYCWGDNSSGSLGDGTVSERTSPVPVAGGFVFKSIALGEDHTCGATDPGTVYCWGDNTFGQLGNGLTIERHTPTLVRVPQ
jgi:alpha-tubulin suppressor-like RCC1 family protein